MTGEGTGRVAGLSGRRSITALAVGRSSGRQRGSTLRHFARACLWR